MDSGAVGDSGVSPPFTSLDIAWCWGVPAVSWAAIAAASAIAAFTAAIGAVAALPWILQFTIYYVPKVAIPEAVSALAFSVWAIVLAKIMLKPQAVSQIEKNSIS